MPDSIRHPWLQSAWIADRASPGPRSGVRNDKPRHSNVLAISDAKASIPVCLFLQSSDDVSHRAGNCGTAIASTLAGKRNRVF